MSLRPYACPDTRKTQNGSFLYAVHPSGKPPRTHGLFSRLEFTRTDPDSAELAREDDPLPDTRLLEDDAVLPEHLNVDAPQTEAERGGWLEGDDIDEF